MQLIPLPPHGDKARHRIDVPEQRNGLWPVAALAHGVAGRVHPGAQARRLHLADQVLHRLGLVAAGAIN